MAKHTVVIAGGGPTGLMLAAELALAQVDVVIVERRATPDSDRSRAGGLHARTIEVLDQRGIADRFLEEGKAMQIQVFGRHRRRRRAVRRQVNPGGLSGRMRRGRSVIRTAADIEFAGWDPSTSWLMAEVEMVEKPEFGLRPGSGIGPAEGGDRIRVVLTDPRSSTPASPPCRTSATPTTTNVIRSAPECCRTPWPKSH
jgi:3-(3-hydroxy-phenyl)propionate hydroxylase